MKRRWSLLLPTITETLEDAASAPLPAPASSSSPPTPTPTPTPDDYMASIQALARPPEALAPGALRLQRAPRPTRLFSKAQTKLSSGAAQLPRGSPSRSLRAGGERLTLRTLEERDCRGRDPVDWLYGQAQMRT